MHQLAQTSERVGFELPLRLVRSILIAMIAALRPG
jgi:hypothetical protein